MLLRPPLARAVAAGRKTQHRQPAVTDRAPWRIGRTYAIQAARGRRATTRVTITTIHTQNLGDLTYQDARAEGFRTRDEFYAHWHEQHGTVDLATIVWVAHFRLELDEPRLLAPSSRPHGSEHGYTSDHHHALRDEPEAVPAAYQDDLSKHARDQQQLHLVQANMVKPLTARIAELENAAANGEHQAQRDLFVIRQRLERHERRAS